MTIRNDVGSCHGDVAAAPGSDSGSDDELLECFLCQEMEHPDCAMMKKWGKFWHAKCWAAQRCHTRLAGSTKALGTHEKQVAVWERPKEGW